MVISSPPKYVEIHELVEAGTHPHAHWAVFREGDDEEIYVCDDCLVRAMDIGVNEVWEFDKESMGWLSCHFDES